MEHYTSEEWHQYKKGECTCEKSNAMEDHLAICDECLMIFLTLIDETEIAKAHNLIPIDFTKKVMKKIQPRRGHEQKKSQGKKKINEKTKSALIYYVAAASITLIFMGSGVFQTFVEKGIEAKPIHLGFQLSNNNTIKYNWSDEVVKKAANWIEKFEDQRRFLSEEK